MASEASVQPRERALGRVRTGYTVLSRCLAQDSRLHVSSCTFREKHKNADALDAGTQREA